MAARSDGSVIISIDGDDSGLEKVLNLDSAKAEASLSGVGKTAAVVTTALVAMGAAAVSAATLWGV